MSKREAHGDLFTVLPPEKWSGYHRLVCGILRRAALDAGSSNGHSENAREWLRDSAWASYYLDAIGLDETDARRFVDGLPPGAGG